MQRLPVTILLLMLFATSGEAHRLKVFAKTEAGTISGYGFFIGGGRPQGSELIVTDPSGKKVHRALTAADGSFSWTPGSTGTFHLTLNSGEGHIASTTVTLGTEREIQTAQQSDTDSSGTVRTTPSQNPHQDKEIEAALERVLERHLNPLRESIEIYESRLRFKDIIAGIAMIIGLAGIAMWAVARNKSK